MKIRIRGNSVRMRISKSELDTFAKEGHLEEVTEFGNPNFGYALQSKPGIENLSAEFSGNKITVYVPEEMRTEWTKTDIVGFDNNMDIGNGKSLFILIEKDYACIDNVLEDQSDNFVNPNAVC